MKIVLLALILGMIACDNPQRTRFQTNPTGITGTGVDPFSSGGGSQSGTNPSGTTEEDDIQSETGFSNCSLGFQYYGGVKIGHFGLCQSTINASTFKLKMAETDTAVGTCFIPIHIMSNGNSFKLGIAECVHNEANKVYDMILTKERSEPINGVMVIKYDNPPVSMPLSSYINCMSAKNNYILSRPGCQYDPACLADADAYAQYVCNQFKSAYSAFYVQVAL